MGIKSIWVDILNFGPLLLTYKTEKKWFMKSFNDQNLWLLPIFGLPGAPLGLATHEILHELDEHLSPMQILIFLAPSLFAEYSFRILYTIGF